MYTFEKTIHDAPADVHERHGEETVQTSARLATPEEIAALKATYATDAKTEKAADNTKNQKISVLLL